MGIDVVAFCAAAMDRSLAARMTSTYTSTLRPRALPPSGLVYERQEHGSLAALI